MLHDDQIPTRKEAQSVLASTARAKDRTLPLLPKARPRLARILVNGEPDALRLIAALLALLYPITSTEAEIKLEWWQTLGAPCTLQSDFENGKCYTPEVKRRPVWE